MEMILQFLLLVSLLLSVAFKSAVGVIEKEEAFQKCVRDLSISTELKEHFLTQGELPEGVDESVKCVFLCISKNLGWTDDDGDINKDKLIEYVSVKLPHLDKDHYEPVIHACSQRTETDPCERWYEFSRCQIKAYIAYQQNGGT